MKRYILPLLFCALCLSSKGQTIQMQGYLPQTKTADALAVERYTTYPMDYSTGLPNITIPLYEIVSGDITLPISLSYHSSGFKPNEAGGRIALGWTLNAEPSISKQVRGINDEKPFGFMNYYRDDEIQKYGRAIYKKGVVEGKYDNMADLYFYKLADRGGSFTMTGGRGIISQPYNDLKITKTDGYTIEDENGLLYNLGRNLDYRDIYSQTYLPVRYLCSEITSKKTKSRIDFVYNDNGLRDYDYRSYSHNDNFTITKNYMDNSVVTIDRQTYEIGPGGLQYTGSAPDVVPYVPEGLEDVNGTITTQPLRQISFDGGYVIFQGNNRSNGKDLNLGEIDILVKDKTNKTIKEITLYCSPYRNYGNVDMQHRKLDSISISVPGGDVQKYRFAYYEFMNMPDRDTRDIDYWGFYSGPYYGSKSLVSSFSTEVSYHANGTSYMIPFKYEGRDRSPDVQATKSGVLSKITNPNGVEAQFYYEGNMTGVQPPGMYLDSSTDYSKINEIRPGYRVSSVDIKAYPPELNIDVPVGGLRIAMITEKDNKTHKTTYRRFTYGCRTEAFGDYVIKGWGVPKKFVTDNAFSLSNKQARIWYSNPIEEITFNGGAPVLYSYVEEHISGDNSKDSLITEYYYTTPRHDTRSAKFTFDGNACQNISDLECAIPSIKVKLEAEGRPNIPFHVKTFDDEQYGQLYKKIDFVSTPNGKKMVRKEEYDYKLETYGSSMWSEYLYLWESYSPPHGNYEPEAEIAAKTDILEFIPYGKNGYITRNVKQKETITDYDPEGNGVSVTKNFDYNSSYTKVKGSTTSLNGDKVKKEYFTYADKPELQHHKEDLSEQGAPGGILVEHKTVVGADTTYMRQKITKSVIDKKDRYNVTSIKSKTAPGSTFDEVLNIKYDDYGNIIETIGLDGTPTAYIWSYNNQQLVAKIENARFDAVKNSLYNKSLLINTLNNQNTLYSADLEDLNSLRTLFPQAMVYTYTYKPLVGMTSATDPSGKTIYYEYDSSNRLKRTFFEENDASGNYVQRTVESYEYNVVKK